MSAMLAPSPVSPPPAPPPVAAPPIGGQARQPRVVVKLNGTDLGGVLSVRTVNVAHSQADTFEVTIALQLQPAGSNWTAWGTDINPEIEVLYGLLDPSTGTMARTQSAVLGPVDSIEIDQPTNTAVLKGRDYSSVLIDTQSYENFQNQTASQIATKIAQRHGLTPQVTATKIPVGSLDEGTGEYSRVTRRESEWDLLTNLARNEAYICFVRERTLYFQPDTPPSGQAYALIWKPSATPGAPPSGNFTSIKLKRSFTLARDIVVKVISHNRATGKTIQATQTAAGGGGSKGSAKTGSQTYIIDIPGLTQAQATARATQIAQQYGRFERVVEIHMPGDPFLTFEQPISLSGTGTDWDNQKLYADRIERDLSMKHGFQMVIRAKNHSTSQTATNIPGATP